MATPLRIAVIGLGTMAQSVHLPLLTRRHDRFEIAAIVDISKRRREDVAKKWRFSDDQVIESVSELVSKVRHNEIEIDAAIFSADGVKADDILALIKRGIRVLVEPPVGYGVEEIERIAEFERIAGRSLVMVGYSSLYDTSVKRFVEENLSRDLRTLEFETLMPASAVMFARHNVTAAAYDLPTELRSERRTTLKAAVEAGAGEATTQRDRDLYMKGLLTGVMAQLALLRTMYGPLSELHGVRHWPKQVIPGSIELTGAMDKGPHVRIAWHYLPFAPEYHDTVRFISTRRQGRVDLPEESDLDRRGSYTMTHKSDGAVQTISKRSDEPAPAAMLEAFYQFAAKGEECLYGLAEAVADTALARTILGEIVGADGRTLDPEPEYDPEFATEPQEGPQNESTVGGSEGIELDGNTEPSGADERAPLADEAHPAGESQKPDKSGEAEEGDGETDSIGLDDSSAESATTQVPVAQDDREGPHVPEFSPEAEPEVEADGREVPHVPELEERPRPVEARAVSEPKPLSELKAEREARRAAKAKGREGYDAEPGDRRD